MLKQHFKLNTKPDSDCPTFSLNFIIYFGSTLLICLFFGKLIKAVLVFFRFSFPIYCQIWIRCVHVQKQSTQRYVKLGRTVGLGTWSLTAFI